MKLVVILVWLQVPSLLDASIFVYNSEDSSSVQAYDCIDHQLTAYCRRPSTSIALERDGQSNRCYHNGTRHSFRSLRMSNVTVHTVLQHWRSSMDKADHYAYYLQQPMDAKDREEQLCECIDRQSFGKNCEYLLPWVTHSPTLSMPSFCSPQRS